MKLKPSPTQAFFAVLWKGKIALVPWTDPREWSMPSGLVSGDVDEGQIELLLKSTHFAGIRIKSAKRIDTDVAEETKQTFLDSPLYECVVEDDLTARNPEQMHFVSRNCASMLPLSEQTKRALAHPEIKSRLT